MQSGRAWLNFLVFFFLLFTCIIDTYSATFFAAMDPDGMHLGNPKTSKIFIKNFFADFRSILGKGHVIKDFKKCDFEPIRKHLNEQKIINNNPTFPSLQLVDQKPIAFEKVTKSIRYRQMDDRHNDAHQILH